MRLRLTFDWFWFDQWETAFKFSAAYSDESADKVNYLQMYISWTQTSCNYIIINLAKFDTSDNSWDLKFKLKKCHEIYQSSFN